MTDTITLPHQVDFFQWTAANQVGLNTGTLGSSNVQTNEYSLFMIGANDTLINTSAILDSGGGGNAGVGIRGTNEVITNQVGGIIAGYSADTSGILGYGAGASITNFGLIASGGGGATAIVLNNGGFVSNASTGTLSGSGIFMQSAAGTVVNAGKIFGGSTYGGITYGGIDLTDGGLITNLSGGTITANGAAYGVQITGAAGTVTNAGTIDGGTGYAVELAADFANRVIVDQGAVFRGTVSGGSAVGGSTLELASSASKGTLSGFGTAFTNFGTLAFDPAASWLVVTNPDAITSAVIDGFVAGDTIDVNGFTAINTGAVGGGTSVTLTNSGGTHEVLQFATSPGNVTIASGGGISGTELTTVCFCIGTLIGTPDGEVQVEKLRLGDMVSTAHNGPRAVKWVGKGKALATRGKRGAATPVIVRKGALADNVPNRDLRVTRAHSLYIDGVLIPVEFLVNHRTILWDDFVQEMEIYHVELDRHDVLIANGALAESYRDDGNRWLFHNANSGWHLPPQDPYAPVLTGGPVVDTVWRRLLDRAGPRRLPPMTDDPDLHLVVDGTRVDAEERQGSVHVFRLPPSPERVVIASREAVPAEFGIARDPRSLGVALRQLAVRRGAECVLLNAADERLTAGFHAYEPSDCIRWTDGYAELPATVFARFDKGAEVMLHLGGATQYPDAQARPARAAA
jgi:antigen 43